MKNLFFLACILISFNFIQAQPQCEKMINDLKDKMLNDRPQDFDLAMKIDEFILWNPGVDEESSLEGTPTDPRFAYIKFNK